MPLNPFATAFTPGLSHQPHKATAPQAVSAPPVLEVTTSFAAALNSSATTATFPGPPAAAVALAGATPSADTSTNSSADDTLQLEFEDLFHRGQNVSRNFVISP